MSYQMIIPPDLSIARYISGFAALNLPSPEGTSGDWHFCNLFYREEAKYVKTVSFIAGEHGEVDTSNIYGAYGLYVCEGALRKRGLQFQGVPYAANHFRAILDILYLYLKTNREPTPIKGATEDFLDTERQQREVFEQAEKMRPALSSEQAAILDDWLHYERCGNRKYAVVGAN